VTAPLRFDGRVAIVTGAGRGLGAAYARLLAERGAAVVVNDVGAALDGAGRDGRAADAVVAAIHAAGGSAVADHGDVRADDEVAALVARAVERFGRLDIIINNAGIVRAGRFPEEVTRELLQQHLDVHLLGSFAVTRAAWPHLRASGSGRVVLTASSAIFGDANVVAYSAAKSAMVGLTRSLAQAGAGDGIVVNAVAPSAQTRMAGAADPSAGPPGAEAGGAASVRGRAPEQAAAVVAYLAHAACTTSGGLYSAGGGTAARIALAVGPGHAERTLTPEAVAEHWAAIDAPPADDVPPSMIAFVDAQRRHMSTI